MKNTLLIANRGEIACRVIRTARALGWKTVAVYSDADARALHVRLADTAVRIGAAPASESYLRQDAVLDAARRTGAQFIHPGYGFLAENAAFARACEENNITFVGPTAAAIDAMGDKSAAKHRMEAAGVPCLPGYHDEDQSDAALLTAARQIGFPVLLKPSAGGGGKGMHIVHSEADLPALLETARREARGAFGDDRMLIEKYLERARHVEIQVFRDTHGNAVYLFERDCSVQRRHQKIIEEAPAPGVDDALRTRMGEAAVQAADAIEYRGAGTVEFLLAPDHAFYFMEMNTRLQVEHPVTEMITGQDLVAWQLAVALGDTLPLRQEALSIRGHAVEARLYAEDPDRGFLPSIGAYRNVHFPDTEDGLRIDSAILPGTAGVVSAHYDPMLAKVIAWGQDRPAAVARLADALAQIQVPGITTNAPFNQAILQHPAFQAADLSTRFLEDHEISTALSEQTLERALAAAAIATVQALSNRSLAADPCSPWARIEGWQLNAPAQIHLRLCRGDVVHDVRLLPSDCMGTFQVEDTGLQGHMEGEQVVLEASGVRRAIRACVQDADVTVFMPEGPVHLTHWQADASGSHAEEDGACHAPMSGTIVAIVAEAGTDVARGDSLVVMEAMKMEHTLRAPAAGRVQAVLCAVGELVQEGQTLLELEESE